VTEDERVRELEASLSDEERAMLDDLADKLAERRMASAALFFLESVKPLGFIASQMMIMFRPLVAIVWHDPVRWDRLQTILEKRGSLELLLRRLEARG
jgi:hypothetical protein